MLRFMSFRASGVVAIALTGLLGTSASASASAAPGVGGSSTTSGGHTARTAINRRIVRRAWQETASMSLRLTS